MNITEKLLENEKLTKIVSAIIMFIVGIIVLIIGLSLFNTSFAISCTLFIFGLVMGILGGIPLLYFWCKWQDLED